MSDLFYTTNDLLELGVTETTVNRWSADLRNTAMVHKTDSGRVLFTEAFRIFVEARGNHQGPANLPEPERIADLCILWLEMGSVGDVAAKLEEPELLVKMQLKQMGII